jgi:hypothetical protein
MTTVSKRVLLLVAVLILTGAAGYYRAQSVPNLAAATNAFLVSLTPEQLAKVKFDFKNEERFNWFFIPRDRNGLMFKDLTPEQRLLAHAMASAALGQRGYIKAASVMSLDQVLFELEQGQQAQAQQAGRGGRGGGGFVRDPERYYLSVFGEPSATGTWGWRVEGHHVSVNITMDKGKFVASTPTFLGANPAEVRTGPRKGLRVLASEEDLARDLLAALSPEQKKAAIVDPKAPNDIITSNSREAKIGAATGIAAGKLNAKQKDMLVAVIREYAERNGPESSVATMKELMPSIDKVHFAWLGPEERGQPHYHRIQGPTFLIEYDNVQNQANHIHSVWRDLKNDWGVDLLREHYKTAHLQ